MTDDRYEVLVVRVVDGVASPAERQELMAWVADKPALQAELQEHLGLNAVTADWLARVQLDAVQDAYDARAAPRLVTGLGLGLLALGYAARDPEVPLWVLGGTAASLLGVALLLGAAIVRRLRTAPHDRYTEVIR